MLLKYSWEYIEGVLTPTCSSSCVNEDGVSLIACLLMDTGGRRYLDTVSWLKKGIEDANAVLDANVEEADWAREDWGAKLCRHTTEIYSLHDENYNEIIDTLFFKKALIGWVEFIQLAPSKLMVEVSSTT